MGMKAIVSEKGQVTIPKAIRDRMGLRKGQALEFGTQDGKIVVTKVVERDRLESVVGIIDLPGGTDRYIEKIRGKARIP